MTYKIQMPTDQEPRGRYSTLTQARAAIRKINGGKLYGKFIPEGEAIEGWNLAKAEGSDAAVIVRS